MSNSSKDVCLSDSVDSSNSDWEFIERKISEKMLKKIEKNDTNIRKILLIQEKILKNISTVVNENKNYMEENRKIYTQLLNNCYAIQKETKHFLCENRKCYISAIERVYNKEEDNIKELKPILEEMKCDQEKLTNQLDSPINDLRIDNHLWRKYSHKNQPTIKHYMSNMFYNK